MSELQLRDYYEGYVFDLRCRACAYEFHVQPHDLADKPHYHPNLYLEELEKLIPCPRCKKSETKIMVILKRERHHFVGGLV